MIIENVSFFKTGDSMLIFEPLQHWENELMGISPTLYDIGHENKIVV